jgi:hypothetical protein
MKQSDQNAEYCMQMAEAAKGEPAYNRFKKKFIPRINRAKADRLVAELLQRATDVNRRGELTHHIASIHVFGSYLTDSDSLGDIDIDITIDPETPRSGQPSMLLKSWRIIAANSSAVFFSLVMASSLLGQRVFRPGAASDQ